MQQVAGDNSGAKGGGEKTEGRYMFANAGKVLGFGGTVQRFLAPCWQDVMLNIRPDFLEIVEACIRHEKGPRYVLFPVTALGQKGGK